MRQKLQGVFHAGSFLLRRNIFLFVTIGVLAVLSLQSCKKDGAETSADLLTADAKANARKAAVDIQLVASNLPSPLGVEESPDGSGRLFIFDQTGKVYIVSGGNLLQTPFLDISSRMVSLNAGYDERGLIGFTFHPGYSSNGKFYVHYQAPPRPGGPTSTTNWNNLSRLSEFSVSANPDLADMSSERVIMEWDDPQGNHNGGTVAFGPDDYLYIAIGDGGGANDVAPGHVEDWYAANAGGNAQNIEANIFGKVLRIDVNSGSPFSIPADNPFVGKTGMDEIWAYGLRNPYRFSFDMGGSRDLILGDAGQVLYEEINVIRKGANYGWNVKEGRICFNAASNNMPLSDCPNHDGYGNMLTNPKVIVHHWLNSEGGRATTVIGGNVYRGQAIPALAGQYIFGSFSQTPATADGELFAASMTSPARSNGQWPYSEIELESHPGDIGYYLKGFGQDLSGEIYLAVSGTLGPTGATGKVYKLVPAQ